MNDTPNIPDPARFTDRTTVMPAAPYTPAGGKRPASHFAEPDRASKSKGGRGPARRGRGPLIALAVVAGLAALAYGGGVAAFSNICYPNTSIADTDVSLMTRDLATERVKTSAANYRLTVEGDGFSWSFEPESGSDVIDASAAVARVIEGNEPLAWPVRLFEALTAGGPAAVESGAASSETGAAAEGKDTAEDGAPVGERISKEALESVKLPDSFDREAFSAELDAALEAFNAGRTGTFDAAGAYDAEVGAFTLEKARSNRKLDKGAIELAALEAVSTLTRKVKLDERSFIPLANGASDEEVERAIDDANGLIGTSVTLKMGGAVVATLDGATFAQWMTFDEALKPTLSIEPLTQWVRDLAQNKLDTVGSDRTYTRPDGKVVTVGGGTYGWNSNEAELVKVLQEAIATKKVGDIEIPTLQQAAAYTNKGERDWGAYCDIDLSEQYCRYYDAAGNLVWESGCVTGNPNTNDATPTGIYVLNAKRQNETLIGFDEDKDGKPDYESPVAFWMPFVGNAIGLHDANWQPMAYFSNPQAYTWAGSHGCINLPTGKAAELYNLIQVGDCVITHY